MPDLRAPEQLAAFDLEKAPYFLNGEGMSDAAALELVLSTFSRYASARQSHEERWRDTDRLYHGVVRKRMWEGTQTERASLPVMIIYDQVEAAYPILTEALFDHYPAFFDVEGTGDVAPAEAVKIRDGIADILDTPYDESGQTALPHLGRVIRQILKYGDGLIELSWDAEQNRFIVEQVDIRDIYLDPNTPGPVIDWSPAVIRREMVSVEKLISLRGVEGMTIPSDDELNWLAQLKFWECADDIKTAQAAARKDYWSPDLFETDPRHRHVEVLKYWTKDKLVWVLGRRAVAANNKNPFGFLPFAKAPFTEVDGKAYSMSLADALEADQKYAQGIRNARLDNLALALNPPRTTGQGTNIKPGARVWRPGMLEEVSKPEEVTVHKVENYTADGYREEQLIMQGAMRRTGINELAQSGVPTPSNANRSATGVAKQASAASTRLRTAIKNFEDYLIVPMLYKIVRMMKQFGPEEMSLPSGGAIDKASLDQPFKWKMRAASRMIARDRLGQFLPLVAQFLFNPDVAKQANMQGKTIDFNEFERFFQESTATAKAYRFFRPMSEEEQAEMNKPDPKTLAMMQMKQQDAQTRTSIAQQKNQTELQKAQIAVEGDGNAAGEASALKLIELLLKDLESKRAGANDGAEKGSSGAKAKSGSSRAA
jgi:hypothetical protein